ncbi:MAG TPA: stage IV sporulation protein A [Firmicutes bacterium]|nr:stage IV sporulation protein A [Bacillota bacterium]
MEKFDIFRDITERTAGSVYIGVVGPVRTGKSTFIKRFMDLLVLPHIEDVNARERTVDELPQAGAGRQIMTTQPHFVPDEPVRLNLAEGISFQLRLVDCVGYPVEGAKGFTDETGPRMVRTPWNEEPIPFQLAAEIGTRKVIAEHSTIGLVVVTDGSITDIQRDSYIEAEERVIRELKELGKPFLVLLNTTKPEQRAVQELAANLERRYGVKVIPVNCLEMTQSDLLGILREVLYEFPVREIGIDLPAWVEELELDHWLHEQFLQVTNEALQPVARLRDIDGALSVIAQAENAAGAKLTSMELGTGTARIQVTVAEELFYKVLQELTGFEISGNHHLIRLMKELSVAKREYDKLAEALQQVKEHGYGIVAPRLEDITFDEPEIIRRGGQFGVRLKASAPSLHLVQANIMTEVTPFVGTEKQGEELARYLTEEFEHDPGKVWNSDFLGKSLQELIREGIQSKLTRMPENAQDKLRETLSKIINEGSGGLICIIL